MDDLVKQLLHATVSIDGDFDVGCNVRDAAVERLERSDAAITRANAATAAAYEVAAKALDGMYDDALTEKAREHALQCAERIRALATPDQTAALDKLIAEAEVRVWAEVAAMVRTWRNTTPMTGEECANAILDASKKGGQ